MEFIKTDIPNGYKLKDIKTGKFLESLFGTLRLNPGKNRMMPNVGYLTC